MRHTTGSSNAASPARPGAPVSSSGRRKSVFISYAREDKAWKDRLVSQLESLSKQGVTVWHDGELKPGEAWRAKIASRLRRTRTAVLLVSPHFLDSDFISRHELPELLEARRAGQIELYWLPVSECGYETQDFAAYSAVSAPDRPLDRMAADEAESALGKTAKLIQESVRGSRVLIAGSMNQSQDGFDRFRVECERLGRGLAERGYTLVIGSHRPKTADRHVMEGANQATNRDATTVIRVGTSTGFARDSANWPGRWPRLEQTDLFVLPNWYESRPEQVMNADVVVAVGGGRGTSDLLYEAAWQRKPVIPIARHGGTARSWFQPLTRRLLRAEANEAAIRTLRTEFDLESILALVDEFTRNPETASQPPAA